ncbi:RNA 2',3'-cyclic phosphodiesterase [Patulibacter sp. NPDC049589]|uniref:RNA 2',3'-cyclic phosphodiesterase n=1 Tax=Patulibacter sp. NPDC049589 TaxID=3154731 RepID=UPI003444DB09
MARAQSTGPRLFVALEPPAPVREELAAWLRVQRPVAAIVRPVAAADIHLTLAFLGPTDAGAVERVVEAVASVGSSAVCRGLSTGAPRWLPSSSPRALTIDVHDDRGDLGMLHHDLSEELAAAIGRRDDQPFRPHITVARRNPALPLPARPLAPTPSLEFEAAAIALYRSALSPDGAQYGVVERVPMTDD